MKLQIDFEKCTGHGRCYSLAPEVYEPDDVGLDAREGGPARARHRRASWRLPRQYLVVE